MVGGKEGLQNGDVGNETVTADRNRTLLEILMIEQELVLAGIIIPDFAAKLRAAAVTEARLPGELRDEVLHPYAASPAEYSQLTDPE